MNISDGGEEKGERKREREGEREGERKREREMEREGERNMEQKGVRGLIKKKNKISYIFLLAHISFFY